MDIEIATALEQVLNYSLSAITVTVIAVVGAGIRYLFSKIKNAKLKEYGELIAIHAEKTVKTLAQTMVDEIKDASVDGKISDKEKQALKDTAIESLRASLPDVILIFMTKANSDIDDLLEIFIEAAVYDMKRNGDVK